MGLANECSSPFVQSSSVETLIPYSLLLQNRAT